MKYLFSELFINLVHSMGNSKNMNCLLKALFLFVYISIVPILVFAQEPIYQQFTEKDGLPSSEVYHAFQDSKGYIWFATNNGVSRFNGSEFTNFGLEDGLPDLTVFEIYEDYKGRIWFIPLSGKLSYYREGEVHLYPFNNLITNQPNSSNGPIKNGFYIDTSETVYLSMDRRGLSIISKIGRLEIIDLKESFHFAEIITLDNGNSILIRRGMDAIYPSAHPSSYFCKVNAIQKEIHFTDQFINRYRTYRSISISKDDNYYISYWNDLLKVNKQGEIKRFSFDGDVVALYFDESENLWVGTRMHGVYCFDKQDISKKPKQHFFKDNTITSVLHDNEEGYWFTSYEKGVFHMPTIESKNIVINASNDIEEYTSVIKSDEDIYTILRNNNSAIRFNRKYEPEILNFKGDKNSIKTLFYKHMADIYVGTPYGVYNKNKNSLIEGTPSRGSCLGFYSKGNKLYCATNLGYIIIENDKIVFTSWAEKLDEDKVFSRRVNSIYINDTSLFLGCPDGLWYMQDSLYKHFSIRSDLFKSRIVDIKPNEDEEVIFFATKGNGVVCMDSDSIWQISEKNGLASNIVNSVEFSANSLWVGSNKGLDRILFLNNQYSSYELRNYSDKNALSSNKVNDIFIDSTNIYLATGNGINVFDVNEVKQNEIPPPIYITNFSINSQDTIIEKNYVLAYNENQIQIHFNGLTYKSKGNIACKYKLEGANSDWVSVLNNNVLFNALQPGKYTFQVKAANEEGVWSKEPAEVSFKIKPPFWKTWWFITMEIILFLLVVTLSFLLWYRTQAKKNKMNTDLIKIRQQALGSQMNPHFIFNSLNSIQNYILQNDKITSQKYLSDFAALMRKVLMNSQSATISLAEELSALMLYIQLEEVRFQGKFTYEIRVDQEVNMNKVLLPPLMLQPFVENAIWHGLMPKKADGLLTIEINPLDNGVICIIEDNGVGRKKATDLKKGRKQTYKSMGSNITQKRLNLFNMLHKTHMRIEYVDLVNDNQESVGTRVGFYLPLEIN